MIRSLTPQQARDLVALGDVEIVDVREPYEWAGGHVGTRAWAAAGLPLVGEAGAA